MTVSGFLVLGVRRVPTQLLQTQREIYGYFSRILGGLWVVISRITVLIIHIRGLMTLLISTHEPPSRVPFSVPNIVRHPHKKDLKKGP